MAGCLFCRVGAKEVPGKIVFENNDAIAFLDIFPRVPGHTLVVPRRHVPTVLELTKEEIQPLFEAVQQVATLLKEKLGPDGFTIGINQGSASGQLVDHLHVHVMPRFTGDKGGSIHSVINNPSHESIEELFKKITS